MIQFQRNASVTAPRVLSNPSAKGQPLVLGPSQPLPTELTTTLDLPNRWRVMSTDHGLMEFLDTLQEFFDQ